MKRLEFSNYEDFICEVDEKLDLIRELDECYDIAIIAKYNETKELIKEFLFWGYDIAAINIDTKNSYNDEYVISIDAFDGNTEVWCEPMKCDHGYITDESTIQYVMDNCSSVCLPYCKGNVVMEVGLGEDEECECDECCECECTCKDTNESEFTYVSRAKDGTPEGFSKTWTTVKDGITCHSSYRHFNSDINMLRKIASEFGVRL